MSYYESCAIAKPEPRKKVKARRKRLFLTQRKSCRAARYRLSGGCCERCGRPLVLDPQAARSVFEVAHIHEVVPRSLGGSAVDVGNTETLCCKCHAKAHGR